MAPSMIVGVPTSGDRAVIIDEGACYACRFMIGLPAMAFAASPSLAAVFGPAATLPVAKSDRAGTSSQNKSRLAGGSVAIAVAAAAAVIIGIVIIADDDAFESS